MQVKKLADELERRGIGVRDHAEADEWDNIDGEINLGDGTHIQVGPTYLMIYAPPPPDDPDAIFGRLLAMLDGTSLHAGDIMRVLTTQLSEIRNA